MQDTRSNIVIPYYSSYGTTHRLAEAYDAAQAGMADVPRVEHEDLRWADGIIWGTPTRFG